MDVGGINGCENDVGMIWLEGEKQPILLAIFLKKSTAGRKKRSTIFSQLTNQAIQHFKKYP